MKTKILAFLGTTFVILAFSGCDFFNSKEGQTSVINFPAGTTGSYTIKTDFPAGSTGQLVTINHKDTSGSADELVITYKVNDSNADGIFNTKDCAGFVLNFNAIPIITKLTGIDTGVTDARTIFIGGDSAGNCTNTTFTLQDGGPKALALTDHAPEIRANSGIPGFIKYGTKASPISQYNLTGLSADVTIISSLGYCYEPNTVWSDANQKCESYSSGGGGGNSNWVQHTWKFTDGSETSYILTRTDNEYTSYIKTIEEQCAKISKSKFYWKTNAGNDSYWKEFGIPDCSGTTTPPDEPYCYTEYYGSEECKICTDANGDTISEECSSPDEPYCYTEYNGSEECKICTDEYGDIISESCWSTNTQPADKKDAERQIKDMQKSLDGYKRDANKEFPKWKKELERFKDKEFAKKIEKYEKLLKRAPSAPRATEFLNKAIKWAKEKQGQLDILIKDADELINTCKTGAEKAQAVLDSMIPGEVSWDRLNEGWTAIRKNSEPCWPLRDSIDFPYRAIEQHYYEFSDQVYELAKAVIEMESYDIKVPDFIDEFFKKFEELQQWVTVGMSCKDNMKTLIEIQRNTTDPEDVEDTQQDIWDAQQDCSWDRQDMYDDFEDWRAENDYNTWQKFVDRAWKVVDENRYVEEDQRVLLDLRSKLETLADLGSEVQTDEPFVQENLQNIERLREEALPLIEEFIKATENGEYIEWEHRDTIKQVLHDSLNVIGEYCNRVGCPFSDEVREVIFSEYYPTYIEGPGGPYPMPNFQDKFSTHFDEEFSERLAQIIADKIAAELIPLIAENFTKLFNETMAEKIADYLERGDVVGENLTIVFNNSEFLGDNKTKSTVENAVELNDILVEFENEDLEVSPEVASVVNEWKGLFVAQNVKNDVINKFKELLAAVKDGSDTGQIIAWLQEKKDDNEYKLATEDRIEFRDSKLEEWHGPYFVASSFQGDTDPDSGRLTGYVRPGGLINRCEALKIAIEAAGIPKAPGVTDWWCSTYVATAEREGFSIVNYHGDTAYGVPPSSDRGYFAGNPTRAETCNLLVEAGNLEIQGYKNEFSDVNYLDPWAEHAATCKKYEIITGQDGKYFDAHGLVKRAEVAAMEVRLRKALQANQLFQSFETGDNTGIFK